MIYISICLSDNNFVMNNIPIHTKRFCISLLFYSICLLLTACQNSSSLNPTICKKEVNGDYTNNGVLNIVKEAIIPSHMNAEIALNDSTLRLLPEYPFYNTICDCLELNDPIITIFGYKDIGNLRLLKLYATDMSHDHLYVLLFDNNGTFLDSICSPKPTNGDQLGYDDGVPVEWHYYSNFYFKNELEKVTTSCDLKVYEERIDTLYYSIYRTKYKVYKNEFVEFAKDSIVKGSPF